ncbi:type 1 fimbrial protein [Burkholderia thailandensis]|uniref:Type 1 fimbrial protein n=1 Tax=Burkholderia thailandensis TaxID=57975 RepID=A0AAW9CT67_BURTH|nr:type 1 fimbrial protein [Burkholderia thailandensis]AIP65127.2 hypothetical protein DR62_3548 [Burkholderia thailandensis]AJY32706.1 hypothetical protein BTM_5791 [Burkholderia thailandensis 34]AOI54638.1 hypothetical protein WI24_22710 [Burkholderia thailandensis]AOJ53992.1 hypothetical protein AQ475_24675 [Burkholderia thailandensis]AOJ59575.1 hypothetical protein AQ477_23895 [Burkholderia thailandensis]
MQRPSLIASSLLAASMFALSSAAHAQQSGIIRFSGMIVEPPCSFSVTRDASAHAQLQPACPRPAKGAVTFVDPQSGAALRTVTFTELSRAIPLPAGQAGGARPVVAVVSYL